MNTTQKSLVGLVVAGVIGLGFFMYISRPLPPATTVPVSTSETVTTETTPTSNTKIFVANSSSTASYEIDETLNGKPKHVVGTTNDVQGQVTFNLDNPKESILSTFKINARTLKTDSERRDNTVGRIVLKSAEPANEYITFEPGAWEKFEVTEQTGEMTFTVPGTLTVAGISKPVVFSGTATMTDSHLLVSARSVVKYADFGIEIPSLSFLAWVDDKVTLSINFVGTVQ